MKTHVVNILIGFTFAVGLGIAGMTDANKVIGFLNLAGDWDPSLAFVMVGAITVHFALFGIILRREQPLLATGFAIPDRTDIDPRLLGGAALFGIGWGLGGFCPGPAITSVAGFGSSALLFSGAMLVGMFLFELMPRPGAAGSSTTVGDA